MSTTRAGRLIGLVTAATLATYLLLALGAATASTAASCGGWPLCPWPVGIEQLPAVGHRIAAVLAGGLVLASAVVAHRSRVDARVRWLLSTAVLAYALQVAIGGLAAVGSGWIASLHLALGVGIFALLVGTLVLALEARTDDERSPIADDQLDSIEPPHEVREAATSSNRDAVEGSAATAERTPSERTPSESFDETGGAGTDLDRATAPVRRFATARAYLRLTKPRLQWLLCLLAVGGMALAALAGSPPTGVQVVATLGAGSMAVAASGVANHVVERDRDRKMDRTADRPLAQDRVSVRGATALCLGLATASIALALLVLSALVAVLLAAAICYYAVVYTLLLKPNTRWSTVVGGGAGALPAVIGWAAATGSIGTPALALAGVVLLWTPAHFYNLGLAYREDYARGGFPLVPVVESDVTTRRRILGYLAATLLAATALGAIAELGAVYALATVGGGAVFLYAVVRTYRDPSKTALLRAFHASNAFLGVLLLAIVVEAALVWA